MNWQRVNRLALGFVIVFSLFLLVRGGLCLNDNGTDYESIKFCTFSQLGWPWMESFMLSIYVGGWVGWSDFLYGLALLIIFFLNLLVLFLLGGVFQRHKAFLRGKPWVKSGFFFALAYIISAFYLAFSDCSELECFGNGIVFLLISWPTSLFLLGNYYQGYTESLRYWIAPEIFIKPHKTPDSVW